MSRNNKIEIVLVVGVLALLATGLFAYKALAPTVPAALSVTGDTPVNFGDGTGIGTADFWKSDGTNITQRIASKPIRFTGLENQNCLGTNSQGVLGAGTCTGGGGGGSGNVATSTSETAGQLAYWTSTGATPATLGKVATGTLSGNAPLSVTAGRSVIGGAAAFSITQAGTGADGYLSSTDFNTFNNKIGWGQATSTSANQNVYTNAAGKLVSVGTSTPTVTAPITYSGTLGQFTSGVSGAFGCTTASAGVTGCLSGTDWSTFNSKAGFSYPFPASATSSPLSFTGLLTISNASTSLGSFGYASSTLYFGAGLATCQSGNFLTFDGTGRFGCAADQTSAGGANPFAWSLNYAAINAATTSILWAQNGINASTTSHFANATSSQLTVTGPTWLSSLTSGALAVDGAGLVYKQATSTPAVSAPITYSGTLGQFLGGVSGNFGCTSASAGVTGCLTGTDWSTFNGKIGWGQATSTSANQFVYTNANGLLISAASSSLALPNTALTNSTISGVALGSNLNSLSPGASLTGTAYNGSAAVSNWGLNTANANVWTALQTFANASSSLLSVTGKSFFGGTATTTIDSAGNIVVPSGSNITITGKSDGCATFATGQLNSTGSACGTSSGGGAQLTSWNVKASGGDFTTIQGALDACGVAGGGWIMLLDASYAQGGTGLVFKGSNCHIEGRGAGTTTISFTGATTLFKTNSAAALYANNSINGVTITGDGTASSIAVDISDMSHGVYEHIKIDNVGTAFRLNDTQNITFYNIVRDITATTLQSFGINASSTRPTNDNMFENSLFGCVTNTATGCVAVNLNNAQANSFYNITAEPTGSAKTVCVQIRSSTLATNNGTFSNFFYNFYCEANQIGITASSTDNRAGLAPVFGNHFFGGEIISNTTNTAFESADGSEVDLYGVNVQFASVNNGTTQSYTSKNHGTILSISDQGFSDTAFSITNTGNFAHNSLDFAKISLLNTSDSTNLLNLQNNGTGATILATSTRGTDFILRGTNGFVGIGTTTPWALFSVNPGTNIGTSPMFAVGSSTKSYFVIDSFGRAVFGSTTPLTTSGFTFATSTAFSAGQFTLGIASSTAQAASYTLNWDSCNGNNGCNNQRFILNQNTTFIINATSSNPKDGARYTLKICQDATGSRTATFATPGQLIWLGGNRATTTVASAAYAATIIGLVYDARASRYDVVASSTTNGTDTRSCNP